MRFISPVPAAERRRPVEARIPNSNSDIPFPHIVWIGTPVLEETHTSRDGWPICANHGLLGAWYVDVDTNEYN